MWLLTTSKWGALEVNPTIASKPPLFFFFFGCYKYWRMTVLQLLLAQLGLWNFVKWAHLRVHTCALCATSETQKRKRVTCRRRGSKSVSLRGRWNADYLCLWLRSGLSENKSFCWERKPAYHNHNMQRFFFFSSSNCGLFKKRRTWEAESRICEFLLLLSLFKCTGVHVTVIFSWCSQTWLRIRCNTS